MSADHDDERQAVTSPDATSAATAQPEPVKQFSAGHQINAVHPSRKRKELENKADQKVKLSFKRRKLLKLKSKIKTKKEAKVAEATKQSNQQSAADHHKSTGKQLVKAAIIKAVKLSDDDDHNTMTKLSLSEQTDKLMSLYTAHKAAIGQTLSSIEIEEQTFPATSMRQLYAHSMTQLSKSIQSLFGSRIAELTAQIAVPEPVPAPKWADMKTPEQKAEFKKQAATVPAPVESHDCGAPLLLILTHSTERCLSMIQAVKDLHLKSPVVKLFARHLKVSLAYSHNKQLASHHQSLFDRV